MKILNVAILLMLMGTCCFGEIFSGTLLEVRDISAGGCAVIYSGKNPLDALSFSEEDAQIVNPVLRFKNIESTSLRVVSSGGAMFEFRSNETNSGFDMQTISGIAPDKQETREWIKNLRKAVETKNGDAICNLYFSDENGTNPDIEIPAIDGKKKMSDIVKSTFMSAQSVKVISRIKFYRGKNYTMVCGDDGKIHLSVDGNDAWLMPIFIYKKTADSPIETM